MGWLCLPVRPTPQRQDEESWWLLKYRIGYTFGKSYSHGVCNMFGVVEFVSVPYCTVHKPLHIDIEYELCHHCLWISRSSLWMLHNSTPFQPHYNVEEMLGLLHYCNCLALIGVEIMHSRNSLFISWNLTMMAEALTFDAIWNINS